MRDNRVNDEVRAAEHRMRAQDTGLTTGSISSPDGATISSESSHRISGCPDGRAWDRDGRWSGRGHGRKNGKGSTIVVLL